MFCKGSCSVLRPKSAGCYQSLLGKILIPHCNTVKCPAIVHIVSALMLVETIEVKELAVSIKGGAVLE